MDGLTLKTDWSNEGSVVRALPNPEVPLDGVVELVGLWTEPEHRRQGHATRLVAEVCRAADEANVVLMLQPYEYGNSQGLKKLEPFYKRFGFERIQTNPVLMARRPR